MGFAKQFALTSMALGCLLSEIVQAKTLVTFEVSGMEINSYQVENRNTLRTELRKPLDPAYYTAVTPVEGTATGERLPGFYSQIKSPPRNGDYADCDIECRVSYGLGDAFCMGTVHISVESSKDQDEQRVSVTDPGLHFSYPVVNEPVGTPHTVMFELSREGSYFWRFCMFLDKKKVSEWQAVYRPTTDLLLFNAEIESYGRVCSQEAELSYTGCLRSCGLLSMLPTFVNGGPANFGHGNLFDDFKGTLLGPDWEAEVRDNKGELSASDTNGSYYVNNGFYTYGKAQPSSSTNCGLSKSIKLHYNAAYTLSQ